MQCLRCGACCEQQGTPPAYVLICEDEPGVIDPRDVRRFLAASEEAQEILEQYVRDLRAKVATPDGPCRWWNPETRLCRFYKYRPQMCRDFPPGSLACHDWQRLLRKEEFAEAQTCKQTARIGS